MKRKFYFKCGLLAVCLFFATLYLWTVHEDWQRENLSLEIELKRLQVEEKILSDFEERQRKVPRLAELSEENLISARELLPLEMEQESFTDELYRAAEKNSLVIKSVQVGEVLQIDKKNFYKQAVKVEFEAEYVPLLNFLREIADGKRFSTLKNISIDGKEKILSCTAEFFIYAEKI